jgi:hypothetical protein
MSFRFLLLLPLVIAIAAQVAPKVQSPVWATRSDATAFEKIENNPLAGTQRASPELLPPFAHHYKTGEPIPADLVTQEPRFGIRTGYHGIHSDRIHRHLLRHLQA